MAIERTFLWLNRRRRLANGWEAVFWSTWAFIYIEANNLIVRHLGRWRAI